MNGVQSAAAGSVRTDALDWLDGYATDRSEAGLRRSLAPRLPAEPGIDLASNDYLGLSRHPRVLAAAVDALRTWGRAPPDRAWSPAPPNCTRPSNADSHRSWAPHRRCASRRATSPTSAP